MNPIVYAIPVFFILMALEWLIARARGHSAYQAADAITSVSLGTVSQLAGVFTRVFSLGIYTLAHEYFRLFDLPVDSLVVWIAALIAYDFFYYWQHRLGHEVNVLWAAHVVHHQSEHFNLSTALRQTSSGFLFGWVFYLPMALAGVPPLVFAVVALIDLLYQYWIHTEQIGRLGWFDRVFASPSNHRVHHGVNDLYVDRNYGGILILWDRLFGTFQEERDEEPVRYGTRAPLRSWNPLWANLDTYVGLAQDSWRARRWRDKLRVWIARPGWRPADVAERFPKPAFRIEDWQRFDPPLSAAGKLYCGFQFALAVALGTLFLATVDLQQRALALTQAALLVATLWSMGNLLEARRNARLIEGVRLLALPLVAWLSGRWLGHVPDLLPWAALGYALLSLIALPFLGSGARHPHAPTALA